MLLIKNGHVLDPMNHVNAVLDILIKNDCILQISTDLDPGEATVIDASGCYVVPGLIDHHTHLYPFANIGLPAEAVCFSSGVTTAVDAGSTGCANYGQKRQFLTWSKLRIHSYLNVCSTGLASLPVLEDVDPAHYDEGAIRECFQAYPNELVGLKLRTSTPIVKELGYAPLASAVALAEKTGTRIMVHCTNPPGELSKLLDILRPGDILTHMYMNQGSCLVSDGSVISAAHHARDRGVLFEAADARLHFGMDIAKAAIQEGFYPDILSTDLTKLSMHLRPTSFNLAMQISKYTALGIPFETVIALCTAEPARILGLNDEIGSLTPGHKADIAVFKPIQQENLFGDRPHGSADQLSFIGHTLYKPVLTVKHGEMVYRDLTF